VRSVVSSILLLTAGAILGFLFSLYRYSVLEIDLKLNVLQIVNVLLTLLIALVVNRIYQRSASTDAMRRQLLLEHVKEISAKLEETYHAFLECSMGRKLSRQTSENISQCERHLSNAIHALEVALKLSRIKTGAQFKALKESRFRLKKLLTDSPFPNGSYSSDRYGQLLIEFKTVREHTTGVLFEVNDNCK
jgi:hypothetical protein